MLKFADRELGKTGLKISPFGFGSAHIGNVLLRDDQCSAAVTAAYDADIRYFDTSPGYGNGISELRVGSGLRSIVATDYLLSTKVGRVMEPGRPPTAPAYRMKAVFDYSYDGTMRIVDQSLQRLGLERIDILLIHDVDIKTHGTKEAYEQRFAEAMNGAYRALEKLRSEGTVKAIGIGVQEMEPCLRFLEAGDLDCVMLSGFYTLIEQQANDLILPALERKGASLLVAGPFASGVLATGSVAGAKYKYLPAAPEILDKVRHIETVCAQFKVELAAAALQFALGHPSVASVVTGAISAEEVTHNRRNMEARIPVEFWDALKQEGILRTDVPIPRST